MQHANLRARQRQAITIRDPQHAHGHSADLQRLQKGARAMRRVDRLEDRQRRRVEARRAIQLLENAAAFARDPVHEPIMRRRITGGTSRLCRKPDLVAGAGGHVDGAAVQSKRRANDRSDCRQRILGARDVQRLSAKRREPVDLVGPLSRRPGLALRAVEKLRRQDTRDEERDAGRAS